MQAHPVMFLQKTVEILMAVDDFNKDNMRLLKLVQTVLPYVKKEMDGSR
jgi:hypothetical protein